jgi:hypothetical protein
MLRRRVLFLGAARKKTLFDHKIWNIHDRVIAHLPGRIMEWKIGYLYSFFAYKFIPSPVSNPIIESHFSPFYTITCHVTHMSQRIDCDVLLVSKRHATNRSVTLHPQLSSNYFQASKLETIARQYGATITFPSKFHCELNNIEEL